MAITNRGAIFIWGGSTNGVLGIKNVKDDIFIPQRLLGDIKAATANLKNVKARSVIKKEEDAYED